MTTVLGILAKPAVNDWRVKKVAEEALSGRYSDVPSLIAASEEYSEWAMQWGTDFHASVAASLREQLWIGNLEVMDLTPPFLKWMDMVGFVPTTTERTFVSEEHGYAGTLDLLGTLNGKPVLADIKTQDFTETRQAAFYEEYPLQLAGYAVGVDQPDITRYSFVVSRQIPGLVATKNWSEKPGSDERDVRKWLALWQCWKELKEWA